MIQYHKSKGGAEIWSDDRATMLDYLGPVTEWLNESHPGDNFIVRKSPELNLLRPLWFTIDPNNSADYIVENQVWFNLGFWKLDRLNKDGGWDLYRLFRYAHSELGDILGPEVDPITGYIIGRCPVTDTMFSEVNRKTDEMRYFLCLITPGVAANVWATMTGQERLDHPRIGLAARRCNMDEDPHTSDNADA